jgi:hypothetical protein
LHSPAGLSASREAGVMTRELEKFAIEFEDAKTGTRFVFHAEAPRVVKNKLFELLANHPAVSKLWIWEA